MATKVKRTREKAVVAEPEFQDLPQITVVIEGTLTIAADDSSLAGVAFRGMAYLLAREFMRQQPGLALLYDLDVVLLKARRGSWHFDFKIIVRLKQRIRKAYKKATAAEIATVIMAAPATLLASHDIYLRLFPPVEQCLKSDLPQISISIGNLTIRQPDGRDVPPREPQEFTL
jgi:hypothetical protein